MGRARRLARGGEGGGGGGDLEFEEEFDDGEWQEDDVEREGQREAVEELEGEACAGEAQAGRLQNQRGGAGGSATVAAGVGTTR